MKKMIVLLLSFFLMLLAVSGCIDSDTGGEETGDMNVSDMVVIDDIPAGFEYLGERGLSAEDVLDGCCNDSGFVEACQGIYKSADFDVTITAVETASQEDAEALVSGYKATFNSLASGGDRFVEESVNDHPVTRIIWYVTSNGDDAERYTYVWSNGSHVFQIRGATSDPLVLKEFAEATGY
jgi:hypothetical protein